MAVFVLQQYISSMKLSDWKLAPSRSVTCHLVALHLSNRKSLHNQSQPNLAGAPASLDQDVTRAYSSRSYIYCATLYEDAECHVSPMAENRSAWGRTDFADYPHYCWYVVLRQRLLSSSSSSRQCTDISAVKEEITAEKFIYNRFLLFANRKPETSLYLHACRQVRRLWYAPNSAAVCPSKREQRGFPTWQQQIPLAKHNSCGGIENSPIKTPPLTPISACNRRVLGSHF